MAETQFKCPHCQQQLRTSAPASPGSGFRCSRCGKIFTIPAKQPVPVIPAKVTSAPVPPPPPRAAVIAGDKEPPVLNITPGSKRPSVAAIPVMNPKPQAPLSPLPPPAPAQKKRRRLRARAFAVGAFLLIGGAFAAWAAYAHFTNDKQPEQQAASPDPSRDRESEGTGTVRHLGDIHRDVGRVELAEPCYHEALALYRGQADTSPLDLANAIRPLAILKHDAGRTKEAGALFEQAREPYAAANVQDGVASRSAWLARLSH